MRRHVTPQSAAVIRRLLLHEKLEENHNLVYNRKSFDGGYSRVTKNGVEDCKCTKCKAARLDSAQKAALKDAGKLKSEGLDEAPDHSKTSRFTRNGRRVLRSADARQAKKATLEANGWSTRATRTNAPEDHAQAAKAHLAAAYFHQHAGTGITDYDSKYRHLDMARAHYERAKHGGGDHTSPQEMDWVRRKMGPTHELVYGTDYQRRFGVGTFDESTADTETVLAELDAELSDID